MSFIKQESEISSNDSDFNLQAVKIELDSLKTELPHIIEMNTTASDRCIQQAYSLANDAIMRFFHHVVKYYHQSNACNFGTYHFRSFFWAYDSWNSFCNQVFVQLNIQSDYTSSRIAHVSDVTLLDIKACKQNMGKMMKRLSTKIRTRNPLLADDLDTFFSDFQSTVQMLNKDMGELPTVDIPVASNRLAPQNNPLESMIALSFPEYHPVLFS